MSNVHQNPARLRLKAALDGLSATFRGMTARPDEHNCECHWGSAEDLARLKVPDVWLSLDLLRRTWEASDWTDHASVLRRVLPQLAHALVDGEADSVFGAEYVGYSLVRGDWQQWPAEQTAAIQAFLDAWWVHTLTTPDAAVPVYEVLTTCVEATVTITPWLATWEALAHPVADWRLAQAVAYWAPELLNDRLPWSSWTNDEEELRVALTAWLVRHAPARLRARGAPECRLDQVRLLGVSGEARWGDPYWLGDGQEQVGR